MSPDSIGGGFHSLFPVVVQSTTGTLNDGAMPLIEPKGVSAVKEWQKELYIYRLTPAPPKKDDLQEYIDLYLAEKDDKYLSWFLHYYEPKLNTIAIDTAQKYAMQGHFLDIKEACVLGIFKALQEYTDNTVPFIIFKTRIMQEEIHNYIRTVRTGFTVQSDDEYLTLRKAMALFEKYGGKTDAETIELISNEISRSDETTMEILQSGLRNMQFIDFYRRYADEDSEESAEEVAPDCSFEPYKLLIRKMIYDGLREAYQRLDYREKAMVSAHLGFCRECWSTSYADKDNLDEYGEPKKTPFEKQAFIDIAYDHMLSSQATADRIYRRAIDKMRDYLKARDIDKLVK